MINSILGFAWAFLISVFAIPSIINVAHLKQLLDEPNLRTVHMSLTPRLGGIAIFAGFTSALTIFGYFDKEIQQIIAGCIVLFFVGIKDDIVSVSPFKKFFVQVLATGIVIFIGDIRITSFQGFLGFYELPMGLSYAFTALVIIGITNAINLIDGLDGLAGSLTVLVCSVFGFYFYFSGVSGSSSYVDIAFCLVGGVVGFLKYNIRKAIIFMGDTGSLVCGFIISILAIKFIEFKIVSAAPATAVAIMIIPIVDTLRVFSIRILAGRSPFSPDKNHIHHILKGTGLSSIKIVLVILIVNSIFIGLALSFNATSNNFIMTITVGLALICSIILEILKRNKHD